MELSAFTNVEAVVSNRRGFVSRSRSLIGFLWLVALLAVGCRGERERLEPRFLTFAELRVVRRGVSVTPPGESERAPYPRERLVDGEASRSRRAGSAWLRRDGGATLLVRGPAQLTLRPGRSRSSRARVRRYAAGLDDGAQDAERRLSLAHVRASIEVGSDGRDTRLRARRRGQSRGRARRCGRAAHAVGQKGDARRRRSPGTTGPAGWRRPIAPRSRRRSGSAPWARARRASRGRRAFRWRSSARRAG